MKECKVIFENIKEKEKSRRNAFESVLPAELFKRERL
jgi:hypothetical protein